MLELILVGMLAAVALVLVGFAIEEAMDRERLFDVQAPHRTRSASLQKEPSWRRTVGTLASDGDDDERKAA